jgi:hypothetical protein
MHDMRTLMTNMAPKRQFADFILDSDWLKSFRYQCYCSGWLLVVQSVRKNQQSAEKMGVFGDAHVGAISLRAISQLNPSLCLIFLVPNVSRLCEGLIVAWDSEIRSSCASPGAPLSLIGDTKRGTELVEHSFAIFWGLGKSARFAGRAKNRKLFRWNVTWASIFLFKEWRQKLICNFLLRPRWGCSN